MKKLFSNLIQKLTDQPSEVKFILFVLFTCLVLFGKYIVGDYVYVFNDIGSDTINAYYPKFYFLSNLIHGNFSWYSFNLGLGESTFSTQLFDPFITLLFCLPLKSLSSGIVYSIILKILFVCFFSWKFFNLLIPNQKPIFYASSSLAIAFSGFFILWGQHYLFSSSVAYIPFLLYAFERFLQKEKWLLFVIATALSAMSVYFFYQLSFFALVYFPIRILFSDKYQTILSKFSFGLKSVFFYFLGAVTSSVVVSTTFMSLIESPRIGLGGNSIIDQLTFNSQEIISYMILRLFSNNAFGDALSYNGILNYYETPQTYTLLMFLLFLPQAFFVKDKPLKFLSIVLGIFALLFILTPATSYIFNGFQYASYRWGFIFSTLVSIVGFVGIYAYISEPNQNKKNILVGTACVSLFSILFASISIPNFSPKTLFIKVVLLSFAYIYVFFKYLGKGRIFSILIISLLCVEILTEHIPTVANRINFRKDFEESKNSYFNQNIDVVDYIKRRDTSFYRIVNNNSSNFLNDTYVQSYRGITSYNSLNDPFYLRFLAKTKVPLLFPDNYSYIINFNDRPLLYDLLGVKYNLSNTKISNQDYTLFHANEVFAYKRNTCLPFGFTYDSYMLESQFSDRPEDITFLTTAILNTNPLIGVKNLKTIEKKHENVNLDDFTANEIDKSTLQIKTENAEFKNGQYQSTNNDPMFIISNLRKYEFYTCDVEFDLIVNGATTNQIFWNNDKSYFSPEQSVSFESAKGLNRHKIRINSDAPIKELRIDPIPEQDSFKIENIKITYYSARKSTINIDRLKYSSLNVKDIKGELGRHFEFYSTNNDPQVCINIPKVQLDTCMVTVKMIVQTEFDSDCQIFWKNNSLPYLEEHSAILKINKNNQDSLTFQISDNVMIDELRIDLGRNEGKCVINELSVLTEKKTNSSDILRDKLLEDTLTITHFEDDLIEGTITVSKEKLLFIPIPYNKNWRITINGISVDPILTNYGFMSIPLTKGEHTIILSYFPKSILWGFMVSFIAIIIIILLRFDLIRKFYKMIFPNKNKSI